MCKILQRIFIHKYKVLIAPLDWGLGHATRCIPIIRLLQQAGCEVIVASSGDQLTLLKHESPQLKTVFLSGYNMRYSKHKRWLAFKILAQIPKILLSIRRENNWLKKTVKELDIDFVISDNRFGLYTKQVPCIFITHQLSIEAPYNWIKYFLQQINYKYIKRFTECWVPDFESSFNIAGNLSHPNKLPAVPVKYIGALSRFELQETNEQKFDYLVILSGPEPQRTLLEKKILSIAPHLNNSVLIIRGKPASTQKIKAPVNCTILNHLPTMQLQQAIAESRFVISRSGYTTVMEVLTMQKKSILIPTPGQTEQEYLAKRLFNQNWCYSCNQNEDLLTHLKLAKEFQYCLPVLEGSTLSKTAEAFFNRYQ